jgi:acyl-CoA synthetase (AMP-forming)/AMP-acid ligase II
MQVRGGRIEMNWFKSLWGGAANLGRSDNETIQQRIRRHVERRGGTPAVWFAPDQFCSYSQMNENATVISQALKSASGASSPRVCFPMPRGSSALYGFLGAIECGTCCPLDGKLRQNEFDEAYSVLLPDVVLSSEPQSIGVKVAAAAGIAIVIYEVSSDHGNCRIIDVKPAKNVRRADRLMTLTSGEAPAVLMRTSGTTAQPKLVGLTHANVLAATDTMRVAFELTESDVCITPMPLHHVHGLIAAALSALSAGSSIHCCETFSPRSFDQALRDYAAHRYERLLCGTKFYAEYSYAAMLSLIVRAASACIDSAFGRAVRRAAAGNVWAHRDRLNLVFESTASREAQARLGWTASTSELSQRTRLSTATCAPATSDASTETVICTSLVD